MQSDRYVLVLGTSTKHILLIFMNLTEEKNFVQCRCYGVFGYLRRQNIHSLTPLQRQDLDL